VCVCVCVCVSSNKKYCQNLGKKRYVDYLKSLT
jgi:hypothetical protein